MQDKTIKIMIEKIIESFAAFAKYSFNVFDEYPNVIFDIDYLQIEQYAVITAKLYRITNEQELCDLCEQLMNCYINEIENANKPKEFRSNLTMFHVMSLLFYLDLENPDCHLFRECLDRIKVKLKPRNQDSGWK